MNNYNSLHDTGCRVILEPVCNRMVTLSSLTNEQIHSSFFLVNKGGNIGFLTRMDLDEGPYIIRSMYYLTEGNSLITGSEVNSEDPREVLKYFISIGYDVHIFATSIDFTAALAKATKGSKDY